MSMILSAYPQRADFGWRLHLCDHVFEWDPLSAVSDRLLERFKNERIVMKFQ